uniref:AGC-kinase C-terminal domain-containing protein n=1 Tax=Syphacia muris TaxID=451379 RepID=A0A0N5ALE7_9BILA
MSHEESNLKISYYKDDLDLSNFDSEFTQEQPHLTPTDRLVIMNLDQNEFDSFTFTNADYHT